MATTAKDEMIEYYKEKYPDMPEWAWTMPKHWWCVEPLVEAYRHHKSKLKPNLKYALRPIGGSQVGDRVYSGAWLNNTIWDWPIWYEAVIA